MLMLMHREEEKLSKISKENKVKGVCGRRRGGDERCV